MTGKKQFDEEKVLEHASRVFWERGYAGTSVRDIEEATGLGRGSIYAAYHDKEGLYKATLDHYGRRYITGVLAHLATSDEPITSIRDLFKSIEETLAKRPSPRGCLYTNAAIESPMCAENIKRTISDYFVALEDGLYQALRKAQCQGSLSVSEDPRALARFLLVIHQGMAVLSRVTNDGTIIRDALGIALEKLPQSDASKT